MCNSVEANESLMGKYIRIGMSQSGFGVNLWVRNIFQRTHANAFAMDAREHYTQHY